MITGRTESADFPMLGSSSPSIYNSAPYLSPHASNDEPYLLKLDSSSSGAASLVYATFLGGGSTTGGGGAFCSAVAVDASGASYVVGETDAQGTPYEYSSTPAEAPQLIPFTSDALLTANQGSTDALHMQVSSQGSRLTYSAMFPLKNPAQGWPGNQGEMNGFVTKLSPGEAREGRPRARLGESPAALVALLAGRGACALGDPLTPRAADGRPRLQPLPPHCGR